MKGNCSEYFLENEFSIPLRFGSISRRVKKIKFLLYNFAFETGRFIKIVIFP
jgi:hypothetical protein